MKRILFLSLFLLARAACCGAELAGYAVSIGGIARLQSARITMISFAIRDAEYVSVSDLPRDWQAIVTSEGSTHYVRLQVWDDIRGERRKEIEARSVVAARLDACIWVHAVAQKEGANSRPQPIVVSGEIEAFSGKDGRAEMWRVSNSDVPRVYGVRRKPSSESSVSQQPTQESG